MLEFGSPYRGESIAVFDVFCVIDVVANFAKSPTKFPVNIFNFEFEIHQEESFLFVNQVSERKAEKKRQSKQNEEEYHLFLSSITELETFH